MVYIVVMYNKKTKSVSSCVFDTKKDALKFISNNHLIDKKWHEEKDWLYRLLKTYLE